MRLLLTATLALSIATAGVAQETRTDTSTPSDRYRPSIGLPLPSIGLPLPSLGLPAQAPDRFGRPSATEPDAERQARGRPDGRRRPMLPLVVFPFVYAPSSSAPAPAVADTAVGGAPARAQPDATRSGRVLFEVDPADRAQVFVDGYYIGTGEDAHEGIELPAGGHAVELRAAGFATAAAAVHVQAGRTITYRATLQPQASQDPGEVARPDVPAERDAAGADPSPVPAAATFYVIPGCYMGNVPPAELSLPSSCDARRAVVVRP